MIPRLLGENPSNFSANGLGLITGTVSAFVSEQLNGDYYLEMEVFATDKLFQHIHVGSVISAQPNKFDGYQAFVVEHISKPIDGISSIYATHIAQYRAKLIPVRAFTATSLANALSLMKSRSLESNPFTITTDKTSTTPMANLVPHTFRELMGGVRGSLIDTYGGEFHYDNYSIELLARRGRTSTDIRIMYGRNMTEFVMDEDFSWTDSLTGVVPYWAGADGTTVVGSVQYSGNKSLYPYAKTGILDCTQFFTEQPTAAQLNTYAATWIADKGLPAVNLTVAFDQLQNADSLVQIGDKVTITNSMYNVSTTSRVIGYTYNVLSEEYESIEIGAKQASVNDAITGVLNSASSDLHVLAENVNYSNAISGLTGTNVQKALDELSGKNTMMTVESAAVPDFTFNASGYYDVRSYRPDAPNGYTVQFYLISTWTSISTNDAISLTWDARYVLGTAGATVTGLKIRAICTKN